MLSVQLDHGHKPSETRRLLRGQSEEKIPCLLLGYSKKWLLIRQIQKFMEIFCIYLALVCSLKPILNTVLFTKLAWSSRERKNFCKFSCIQGIVQLWLLLKQQANKQWVKTLSTHSKLACWWVILYSENKQQHHVSLSLL